MTGLVSVEISTSTSWAADRRDPLRDRLPVSWVPNADICWRETHAWRIRTQDTPASCPSNYHKCNNIYSIKVEDR